MSSLAILDDVPSELGVWPQTGATTAAVALVAEHEPAYLLNHSIRSYFYAKGIAADRGIDEYDDELLFLSTVLHDIGLTAYGNGSQRFEVDGADRAAEFAIANGLPEASAEIIWDAIALHSSSGIAGRKRAEVALAHFGIGADIFGYGADRLPAELVAAAHERFPWLDLRDQLLHQVATQVQHDPRKFAPLSFVAAAVAHVHPELPLPGLAALIGAPIEPHGVIAS